MELNNIKSKNSTSNYKSNVKNETIHTIQRKTIKNSSMKSNNFNYFDLLERASSLNNIITKKDNENQENEDIYYLKENTKVLEKVATLKKNSSQILVASPLKKIKRSNITSPRKNNKTLLARNSIFARRCSIMDEFINMKGELYQSQKSFLNNYSKQASINPVSHRNSTDLGNKAPSKLSSENFNSKFQTPYNNSIKVENFNAVRRSKTINPENSIIAESNYNQKYSNSVYSISDKSINSQSDSNNNNQCLANSDDFSLITANDRIMVKYKRPVYDSLSDDEWLLDSGDNSFIINPTSKYLKTFYYWLLAFLIISSVYTPLLVAHNDFINESYLIFDFIIDIMLLLSLALTFNTGFYDIEENLVTNRKKILIKYLKSWFLPDLIMSIPVNSILNFSNYYYNHYQITRLSITYAFKANSPIRMIRLFYVLKLLSDYYLKIEKNISNLFIKIKLPEAFGMLVLFLTRFFFFIHITSCFWIYFIYLNENNWLNKYGLVDTDFIDIYISAIYFILSTIFTVGYGDIKSVTFYERLFNAFLMLFGIFLYSLAVSSFSNYVYKQGENEKIFDELIHTLTEMQTLYELKPNYVQKVKSFLNQRLIINNEDITNLLKELPLSLRRDILFKMYEYEIKKFGFLDKVQNKDILINILFLLRSQRVGRFDCLVEEKQQLEEMIFIKKGKILLEKKINLSKLFYFQFNDFCKNNTISKLVNFNDSKTKLFLRNNSIKINSHSHIKFSKFKTIKILQLCSWDYFGDSLILADLKSPVSLIVNSKWAELFTLSRDDLNSLIVTFNDKLSTSLYSSAQNMDVLNEIIESKIIKKKELLRKYFEDPENNYFSFEFIDNNKIEEDDYSNDEADKYVKQTSFLPAFHFQTEKTIKENEDYEQINKEEDDEYVKKKSYLSRNNKYSKQASKLISLKKLDTVTSKLNENSNDQSSITGHLSIANEKNIFEKKSTIDYKLNNNELELSTKRILNNLTKKSKTMRFILDSNAENKYESSFKLTKNQSQKNLTYKISISPNISNKDIKSNKLSAKSFKLKEFSDDNSVKFPKNKHNTKVCNKNNFISEITNIKNNLIKISQINKTNCKISGLSRRVKTTELYLKLKNKLLKPSKNKLRKPIKPVELKVIHTENFSIVHKTNTKLTRKNNFETTSRSVKLISPPKNKLSNINVHTESASRRISKGVLSRDILSNSPIKYNYRQKSLCQSDGLLMISPVKGRNSLLNSHKLKTIIVSQNNNDNSPLKRCQVNDNINIGNIDYKKEEHLNQINKHILEKQNRINPLYLDNFLKAKLNLKSRESNMISK